MSIFHDSELSEVSLPTSSMADEKTASDSNHGLLLMTHTAEHFLKIGTGIWTNSLVYTMERVQNRLSKEALQVLAEGMALVAIERPLLPGQTPKESGLKLLAAYLKAHNPVSTRGSHHLQELQDRYKMIARGHLLLAHKREFGTELDGFEACVKSIMK